MEKATYTGQSRLTFFLTFISARSSVCMDQSMSSTTGTTGLMKGSRSLGGGPDRETAPVGMYGYIL